MGKNTYYYFNNLVEEFSSSMWKKWDNLSLKDREELENRYEAKRTDHGFREQ